MKTSDSAAILRHRTIGTVTAQHRLPAIAAALGHGVVQVNVPRVLVGPVGAVVEGVGRLLGRYPPLNREKAREAKETWLISSEKAGRDFGYAPEIGLDEGMRETVAWYRAAGWL